MKNLLAKIPKRAQQPVAALVRSIFAQTTAAEVQEQHRTVVEKLHGQFREAALLEQAGPDVLAFAAFPAKHWRQIWSNNPQERVNREIRRRTDVVGIFPNREAILRLVGAVLNEQHDEWAVGRRHMSLESLAELSARREAASNVPALPEAAQVKSPKDDAIGFLHHLTGRDPSVDWVGDSIEVISEFNRPACTPPVNASPPSSRRADA